MSEPALEGQTCPRCGTPSMAGAADCAACGIVFAKYLALRVPMASTASDEVAPVARQAPVPDDASTGARVEDELEAGDAADRAVLLMRAVCLAGLAAWTLDFASHSVASNHAGASVLHLVNLVFHEAGHVLFLPFGQFLTVLGGSMVQVAVPTLCAVAIWRSGDCFGSAVAAWWAGQSLLDLAPYVADARALQLVLLGGRTGAEVEGHDWEFLLQSLGLLHWDRALGTAAHGMGALVMLAALAYAAAVLRAQYRHVGRG